MGKNKIIRKGIHSEETLDCGCLIKNYVGGKSINVGCKNHRTFIIHICPGCGNKFSTKKEMKECVWSHAI